MLHVQDKTDDIRSRYREFHTHNFDDDDDFQKGWKLISNIPVPDEAQNLLKAKIYYYSKKYYPVSLTEYQSWLHQQGLDLEAEVSHDNSTANLNDDVYQPSTQNKESSGQKGMDNRTEKQQLQESGDSCKGVDRHTVKGSNSYKIVKKSDGVNVCVPNDSETLEFIEVADMIEKGLKLPGVKELDIKPTESNPKSSVVDRKKKPWEK